MSGFCFPFVPFKGSGLFSALRSGSRGFSFREGLVPRIVEIVFGFVFDWFCGFGVIMVSKSFRIHFMVMRMWNTQVTYGRLKTVGILILIRVVNVNVGDSRVVFIDFVFGRL